ncbi:MAG: zinc ribbon domain-containing protein [Clostridia bacterium]|nr:zinc ribbon domain-containing protein [Clostridia bacterium]
MICPSCGTINKDTAKICRECHLHLAGRGMRPEDKKKERKYLIIGGIAVAIIMAMFIMFMSLLCTACGDSCSNGGENAINEQVEGEWDSISGGDVVVSSTDGGDNSDFLDDPAAAE